MFCPACREFLLGDAVYCSRCGTSIQRSRVPFRYAGFWRRLAAIFIDMALLAPLVVGARELFFPRPTPEEQLAIQQFSGGKLRGAEREHARELYSRRAAQFWTLAFLLSAPYFALTESSSLRGTIGKHILKLGVTDLNGRRVGFRRALARHFARLLSAMPAWYGFAMAGLTGRKQALHDYLAGTLVVILDRGEEGGRYSMDL